MIAYNHVNEYLNNIELPRSIEEVLSVEHELDGKELEFLQVAKRFLKENIDFESYRFKQVHCIGTCKINLTRTALYFLLDDDIQTNLDTHQNLNPSTSLPEIDLEKNEMHELYKKNG